MESPEQTLLRVFLLVSDGDKWATARHRPLTEKGKKVTDDENPVTER